mmetsp:Transcript_63594/g.132392  ORF Transcript_63594/g.132392 Transcript_63594/m.132392 type:complete len:501 (-) Transcript_63594:2197-3699(-)
MLPCVIVCWYCELEVISSKSPSTHREDHWISMNGSWLSKPSKMSAPLLIAAPESGWLLSPILTVAPGALPRTEAASGRGLGSSSKMDWSTTKTIALPSPTSAAVIVSVTSSSGSAPSCMSSVTSVLSSSTGPGMAIVALPEYASRPHFPIMLLTRLCTSAPKSSAEGSLTGSHACTVTAIEEPSAAASAIGYVSVLLMPSAATSCSSPECPVGQTTHAKASRAPKGWRNETTISSPAAFKLAATVMVRCHSRMRGVPTLAHCEITSSSAVVAITTMAIVSESESYATPSHVMLLPSTTQSAASASLGDGEASLHSVASRTTILALSMDGSSPSELRSESVVDNAKGAIGSGSSTENASGASSSTVSNSFTSARSPSTAPVGPIALVYTSTDSPSASSHPAGTASEKLAIPSAPAVGSVTTTSSSEAAIPFPHASMVLSEARNWTSIPLRGMPVKVAIEQSIVMLGAPEAGRSTYSGASSVMSAEGRRGSAMRKRSPSVSI